MTTETTSGAALEALAFARGFERQVVDAKRRPGGRLSTPDGGQP